MSKVFTFVSVAGRLAAIITADDLDEAFAAFAMNRPPFTGGVLCTGKCVGEVYEGIIQPPSEGWKQES